MKFEQEGAIQFGFPDDWLLLKYDDSRFYRGPVVRLGADRAAVDFVAAHIPTSRLLLLEVKDFRQHATGNRPRLLSGDLAAEVVRKVWDTLGALYAGCRAQKYAELQPFAAALAPFPLQLHAVLLLEEDPLPLAGPGGHLSTTQKLLRDNAQKRRGDLLDKLQSRLKAFRISAFVYDCASVPARDGWAAALVATPS